jgi:hypothetical protein
MAMDRSPKAPLSPQEVAALQALKQSPKRELSRRHRELLLSMGLALAEGEELKLSQAGHARLEAEQGNNRWRHQRPPAHWGGAQPGGRGRRVWDHAALRLDCTGRRGVP